MANKQFLKFFIRFSTVPSKHNSLKRARLSPLTAVFTDYRRQPIIQISPAKGKPKPPSALVTARKGNPECQLTVLYRGLLVLVLHSCHRVVFAMNAKKYLPSNMSCSTLWLASLTIVYYVCLSATKIAIIFLR